MGLSVPTPSGVLDGVATFSWDGAAWQPAGRAMPGVATPFGVLDSVALFNWSGAGWEPGARAMPSIATPSGILDGVAAYAWNGSAWIPVGGAAGAATPSGVLNGIALFSWDGANWQPAGQARQSVPTPYGVLRGVAPYAWNGAAWVPGSSGPAVDINFLSATLDPRIAFTRASIATYFDVNGVLQTAAANVPRFDYNPNAHVINGLLLEEQGTNILLNTATLSTQSVATTAQAYTLSFYGTGSVTLSGTGTGVLNGSGAFPTRVNYTFTPTAGTLTLTVAGSVVNAQLETGPFASSYIPSAGSVLTRAADIASLASNAAWRHSSAETFKAEWMTEGIVSGYGRIIADFYTGRAPLLQATTGSVGAFDGGAVLVTSNSVAVNTIAKAASNWTSSTSHVALNGGPVLIASPLNTGFGGITTFRLMNDSGAEANYGWLRRFSYWPRLLTDAELQYVST